MEVALRASHLKAIICQWTRCDSFKSLTHKSDKSVRFFLFIAPPIKLIDNSKQRIVRDKMRWILTFCWVIANVYMSLLYKHQWNTWWAFARKLDIFTCENNTLCSRVKITPLLWLHSKSRLLHQKTIKVTWFGISLVLKKYFTRSLRSLVKYFSTLEEKFRISARPCNILYLLGVIHYYNQTHLLLY